MPWAPSTRLASRPAYMATDACETFGGDADELDNINSEARGLYCAKRVHGGKGPYYVFNGFYTTVRAGFVKVGTCIYYYVVEYKHAIRFP